METKSLWVETAGKVTFLPLSEDIDVDVAIVGGGITGLTAALLLQRAGKRVAIIDNAQIAMGETGYSTAHLTQILDSRYGRIISDFGIEMARLAAESKRTAIDQIKALTREYGISCGLQNVPGFLYSESDLDQETLAEEVKALRLAGISAELIDAAPLPFKTSQAICVEDQAQFHPRQYLLPIAKEFVRMGGKIYENTRVLDVKDSEPCQVQTENNVITARDVIIAANIPVTNWLFLNTKLSAYRTYALGAKLRTPMKPGLYWDTLDPYHYIRAYSDKTEGDFVIVGGEDHKTGTATNTEAYFHNLERYTRHRFDIESIPYFWSGQIIKPLDGLPYIGLNSLAKHVYVSTGYNGNGITFGTLGAMILSDLILEKENKFASLYQATRLHPSASIGNFVSENIGTPKHFIGDRLATDEAQSSHEIGCNEGKLMTVRGNKVAACRDADGVLHAHSAVCPHMGCIVHWNSAESSWDCPCHGSRFDAAGKVSNGPALQNLKPVDLP